MSLLNMLGGMATGLIADRAAKYSNPMIENLFSQDPAPIEDRSTQAIPAQMQDVPTFGLVPEASMPPVSGYDLPPMPSGEMSMNLPDFGAPEDDIGILAAQYDLNPGYVESALAEGMTIPDLREAAQLSDALYDGQRRLAAIEVKKAQGEDTSEDESMLSKIGGGLKNFFGSEKGMLSMALAFNTLRNKPDNQLAAGIQDRLKTIHETSQEYQAAQNLFQSKDPLHQRAWQYYNATHDMKGAAKLAYGVDTTYGTTPRLTWNPKTKKYQWVQLGSDGSVRPVELEEGMEVPPNIEKVETDTDIYFYDMHTGRPLGSRSKDIGKGIIQKGMAENWLDSIGGGQKTIDNLSQGVAAIDWVLDPSRKDVLDRGFGITGEYLPAIMPETKDLYAKLNQIGAKQFLAGFESLKGGGQISNIEGGQAKQAGLALFDEEGNIKTGLSPDYVRDQLKLLREIYQRGIIRAERGYRVKPGYNPAIHNELEYLEQIGSSESSDTAAPTDPYAGFSIAR